MNPEEILVEALDRWERLSCGEQLAIASRDWDRLARFQSEKTDLQPQLAKCWAQFASAQLAPPAKKRMQARIVDLLELESENAALMETAVSEARNELEGINRTARCLDRVKQSYAPALPAEWSSFS